MEALYEREASRLIGFCARRLNGDRMLAQDLVHEAFARLARDFPRLVVQPMTHRHYRRWLFLTCQRLLIDHYRTARLTGPLLEETMLPSFEETCVQQVTRTALLRELFARVQGEAKGKREGKRQQQLRLFCAYHLDPAFDRHQRGHKAIVFRMKQRLRNAFIQLCAHEPGWCAAGSKAPEAPDASAVPAGAPASVPA